MEAEKENVLGLCGRNLEAGTSVFAQFTCGSSYWNFKFWSNATVEGEGKKGGYWKRSLLRRDIWMGG
jgi:hypothetical protein